MFCKDLFVLLGGKRQVCRPVLEGAPLHCCAIFALLGRDLSICTHMLPHMHPWEKLTLLLVYTHNPSRGKRSAKCLACMCACVRVHAPPPWERHVPDCVHRPPTPTEKRVTKSHTQAHCPPTATLVKRPSETHTPPLSPSPVDSFSLDSHVFSWPAELTFRIAPM